MSSVIDRTKQFKSPDNELQTSLIAENKNQSNIQKWQSQYGSVAQSNFSGQNSNFTWQIK